jgi:hypothetical protein
MGWSSVSKAADSLNLEGQVLLLPEIESVWLCSVIRKKSSHWDSFGDLIDTNQLVGSGPPDLWLSDGEARSLIILLSEPGTGRVVVTARMWCCGSTYVCWLFSSWGLAAWRWLPGCCC